MGKLSVKWVRLITELYTKTSKFWQEGIRGSVSPRHITYLPSLEGSSFDSLIPLLAAVQDNYQICNMECDDNVHEARKAAQLTEEM